MNAGKPEGAGPAFGQAGHLDLPPATILLDQTSSTDPLLAALTSAAAVPRKFDASLLASLVDREPTDPEFVVAFEKLVGMPFVVSRRDGRLRLHNEIRSSLLARLEDSESGREQLRSLNDRVAEYYDREHEQARVLANQFGTVDELLREVSPDRVQVMRAACEDRLIRPLIEAQHHRTIVDPSRAGLDQFEEMFRLYGQEGRVGVCRLLLSSWSTDVDRLADSNPGQVDEVKSWAAYYGGRVALDEGDSDGAKAIAEKLLADPGLAGRILWWTLGLVSESLVAAGQYGEALDAIQAELEARGEPDEDPWNRPLIYERRAMVHEYLWDVDGQAASLELALDAARAVGRDAVECDVLNMLAVLRAGHGDPSGAADCAIQALHIARTSEPADLELARSCAMVMMQAFGPRDPRLAETFHAEARALTRGDVARTADSEVTYAAALVSSGRFEQAHRVLDQLSGVLGDLSATGRSNIRLAQANLLDAEGRDREAVDENRRTVDGLRSRREDRFAVAAALTNAATTEMYLGDLLDDAARAAREARALWAEMGHERGMIFTDVVEAEVQRRRGSYEAARAALGQEPPPAGSPATIHWYLTSAELEIDLGLLDAAAAHLDAAIEESVSSDERQSAASAAARLVEVQLRAGARDNAEGTAARLVELVEELRQGSSYRPTPATELADEENGRAVRDLIVASRRPFDAARNVVEHLEEATKGDPASCWYPLNLAYAYRRLGDEKLATKALESATAKAKGTVFADPFARLAGQL